MTRGRRWLTVALAVGVAGMLGTAPADAVVYKTGPNIENLSGNCSPFAGTIYYSQQTAAGSNVGINPRVGDVFYVGITVSFFQSFDCAADFWAAVLKLPAGVQPAIGDPVAGTGARPICIRRAQSGSQVYDDPRAVANCPTTVGGTGNGLTFDAMSRELRVGPKASPSFPDFGAPTSRFFIGQNAPAENLLYSTMAVLVPVKATTTVNAAMTATAMCTAGTGCGAGGDVQMIVDPAATAVTDPDPPGTQTKISIGITERATVTAVGARIPFTTTPVDPTKPYSFSFDMYHLNDSGTPTTRACGASAPQYTDDPGGAAFYELGIGDLDPQAPIDCRLYPDTRYLFELCQVNDLGATEVPDTCRQAELRTGTPVTDFEPLEETAADRPDSTRMKVRNLTLRGGHLAGALSLQRAPSGGGFTSQFSTAVGQGESDVVADPPEITGLTPWARYDLRSCFAVTANSPVTGAPRSFCRPASTFVAGYITSSDATAVTATSATASGTPSSPYPAGTMNIRGGTSAPADGDPRALAVLTSVATTGRPQTDNPGPALTAGLTGLSPSTTYHWAACFDATGSAAGDEDCSEVRTFVTAAAPTPTPTATPTTTPTPVATPTPTPGPVIDRTRPKVSLKVTGKLKRRRKVTLKVTASDASGIRRVTIKVGKAKAKAARTLRITLPRKKGKLVIVVVVTDKAGNRTTVRRTLVVK